MRSLRAQRGISPIGWIALLIVVGFVSLVTIRLVPVYLDYYAVVTSVRSVHQDAVGSDMSNRDIRQSLRRHMQINDVNDLGYDIVTVERSSGAVSFLIDYEVRRPLMGNVDLMLRFNRRVGN